jgi:hypothetical protein
MNEDHPIQRPLFDGSIAAYLPVFLRLMPWPRAGEYAACVSEVTAEGERLIWGRKCRGLLRAFLWAKFQAVCIHLANLDMRQIGIKYSVRCHPDPAGRR